MREAGLANDRERQARPGRERGSPGRGERERQAGEAMTPQFVSTTCGHILLEVIAVPG